LSFLASHTATLLVLPEDLSLSDLLSFAFANLYRWPATARPLLVGACLLGLLSAGNVAQAESPSKQAAVTLTRFMQNHCIDCHQTAEPTAGLNLETYRLSDLDLATSEQIVKRLRGRQMPPPAMGQPTEAEYEQALAVLESTLDTHAKTNPQPGRTESMRRLTRTEYGNAIRDLLGIPIVVEDRLPADESSHGFDNVTVGELSPTLLSRYVAAAEKISRLAVPVPQRAADGVTIRVPPDVTQQGHVEGLPLGTRGGAVVQHYFPRSGEYEIELRLARDRDEKIEGLDQPYDIDVLIDGAPVHRFHIQPPQGRRDDSHVDAHLKQRLRVTAGSHTIGVTFPRKSASLLEIKRQPFDASFNRHRHPRPAPAVGQISIFGPLDAIAEDADSISEVAESGPLAVRRPATPAEAEACATDWLRPLLRRAYRRPITDADLAAPLAFFRRANAADGFDAGIEAALAAVLVNPYFLFRVEHDRPTTAANETVYSISDIELASRLSFFLWSSLPDDELLDLAETQRLSEPATLRRQVRRMLADERSQALVDNFASQWLYLRNLESITPDLRAFPDFDHNLRIAFRRETESLFTAVLREDHSVLRLIDSPETYLNERLAKHYGIPHVRGSHFRAVATSPTSRRGGLLRHGSILMLTSYATRTSPTVRGNWILKNLLGTPPPPPPPNVPSLADPATATSHVQTLRDRLAQHRADPACASCHDLMDPIGFSLAHFDALGRWRDFQEETAIDAQGRMPDGTEIDGVDQLEAAILARPEMFVGTLTEKLLTFALGRGIEPTDMPAVRQIVRNAAPDNYKLSDLLEGIVFSPPFQMRARP